MVNYPNQNSKLSKNKMAEKAAVLGQRHGGSNVDCCWVGSKDRGFTILPFSGRLFWLRPDTDSC